MLALVRLSKATFSVCRMEKTNHHPYPLPLHLLHHHHKQPPPPRDFFNVFSKNHTSKGFQESSSSSPPTPPPSPNSTVSTELSLSSSFTKSCRTKRNTLNNRERKPAPAPQPPKPCYNNYSITKTYHESSITQSSHGYCSTALKLYDDPWKIKKVLTTSDLGKLNRLLLSTENSMEDLLASVQGNNNNNINKNNTNNNNNNDDELFISGRVVRVWDVETKSMHQLIMKQWASIKNYVLIGNWNQDFVKRRALKKGDEIGLQWDPYNFCFNFSVLKRSGME